MRKAKKVIVTISMTVVWLITLVVVLGATTDRGRLSILLSGILINGVLAVYYSCIGRRPANLKQWLTMY